jgi:ketosteroid isomerase-like protein
MKGFTVPNSPEIEEGIAMRSFFAAVLVLLISSAFIFAQETSKPSGEEGHLRALETAWNHAEQSKDAAALNQLLADTFVYVDYDGTLMNKKQFLASTLNDEVQNEQINNEGMTIQVYGDAAVVNGAYRDKGLEKGKPFFRHGRFTDTWVLRNGAWQCVASQSTLIKQ